LDKAGLDEAYKNFLTLADSKLDITDEDLLTLANNVGVLQK